MSWDGAEAIPRGVALPISRRVPFRVLALGICRGEWVYDTLTLYDNGDFIECRRRLIPAVTSN